LKFDLKQLEKLKQIDVDTIKGWIASIDRRAVIQYGIMGIAFLIFLFFFFIPILAENQKMLGKKKALERRVRSASAKIARVPEMKKQKELYGVRIQEMRDQFFEPEETDQLIEIISLTASDAGVRITASKPTKKELELPAPFGQMYIAVSYDLTIEGMFHQIGAFINGLEEYSQNFAIYQIQVYRDKTKGQGLKCSFMLTAFMKQAGMSDVGGPGVMGMGGGMPMMPSRKK
jgi:Tfp pilus assembly protein PilO